MSKKTKRPNNTWRNLDFIIKEAKKFLKEHPEYDELPSQRILQGFGYFSLPTAIIKYHKGFQEFRSILNKHLGIDSDGKKMEKKGAWRDVDFVLKRIEKFLKEHPEYDELPSSKILDPLGYSSLSHGIIRYHGGFPKFRETIRFKNLENLTSPIRKKSSDKINMDKKNNIEVEGRFDKIDQAAEQTKLEGYNIECQKIYDKIVFQSSPEELRSFGITLENILNGNEVIIPSRKSKKSNTKEPIQTSEKDSTTTLPEDSIEFNYEMYTGLRDKGLNHKDVKEVATKQYAFDNLQNLRCWAGAYSKTHSKTTIKLNPKIKEFYDTKGVNLTEVDGLFINTLMNLNKKKKSSSLQGLTKALHKADPKRYPDSEANTKRKVSVHLAGIKKNKELVENINMNWTLAHYEELIKYLSPVPTEEITRIIDGTAQYHNFFDMIKAGATTKDIREIYVLVGREKEFKAICHKYTMELNKRDSSEDTNNNQKEQRPPISPDGRGGTYKTDLSKHLNDLNQKE